MLIRRASAKWALHMLKMGWIISPYTVKKAAFDLQQKETGSKTVAIATSKYASCGAFLSVQHACQIGHLQDPVTWYGINYTGTQMTQWDFQNKGKSSWTGKSSFVLKVPLRHLRPSVIYSVPCDRILQMAYSNCFASLLAEIFSTVFWLPYCHTLWRHQYLICIIQNLEYLWNEMRYDKKENTILLHF